MKRNRQWVATGIRDMGAEFVGPAAPWKAKSVWVAAALMVLGSGFWRSDISRQQAEAPAQEQTGTASAQPVPQETGPASSAAVGLGASYIGGFLLGWCYRRYLRFSVMVSGAVLAALVALKRLGWFEGDAAAIEAHVRQGSTWLNSQAAALNHYLTGLLPSAAATGVGLFKGFRRRRQGRPSGS
jgi:uncharacterized membrane protein (Fun14 family)